MKGSSDELLTEGDLERDMSSERKEKEGGGTGGGVVCGIPLTSC